MKKSLLIYMALAIGGILIAGFIVTASPPQNPPLPPAKQTLEAHYEQIGLEALKNQTPGRNYIAPPTFQPYLTPTPILGIREIRQSFFRSDEAVVENRWNGYDTDGQLVTVYAGYLSEDTNQGFVAVSRSSPGKADYKEEWFVTPERAGAVRIIASHDLELTLLARNSKTFIFDLKTRSYKVK